MPDVEEGQVWEPEIVITPSDETIESILDKTGFEILVEYYVSGEPDDPIQKPTEPGIYVCLLCAYEDEECAAGVWTQFTIFVEGNILTPDNFPDSDLLEALQGIFCGGITEDGAAEMEVLFLQECGIESLEGIDIWFKNLKELDVSGNCLEEAGEISRLKELETLNVSSNALTKLDLSRLDQLTDFDGAEQYPCVLLSGYGFTNAYQLGNAELLCVAENELLQSLVADSNVRFEATVSNDERWLLLEPWDIEPDLGYYAELAYDYDTNAPDTEASLHVCVPVQKEDVTFKLDADYLILPSGSSRTFTTPGLPESLSELIDWQISEGSESARIDQTGMLETLPGPSETVMVTAYISFVDPYYGVDDPLRMSCARCRVDVSENILQEAVFGAQLPVNKTTVQIFSTEYTEIQVLLKMNQIGSSAMSLIPDDDIAKTYPNPSSYAIASAEFAPGSTAAEWFDLVAVSDRRLVIQPNLEKLKELNAGTAKLKNGAAVSGHVMVYLKDSPLGEEPLDAGLLTVTVKTAVPSVKADPVKLNTHPGLNESSSLLTFKGAAVTNAVLDPGKVSPDWAVLEEDSLYLRLNEACAGQKRSGKFYLLCTVEGCTAQIPVTVSVTAASTAPKITLNQKSITLTAGVYDEATVFATVSPAEFSGAELYWDVVGEGSDSVRTFEAEREDGTRGLGLIPDNPDDGKVHTCKVYCGFEDLGITSNPVTVKVNPIEKTNIKLVLNASGAIDTGIDGSVVTVTASASGYNTYDPNFYDIQLLRVYGVDKAKHVVELAPEDYEYDNYRGEDGTMHCSFGASDENSFPAGYTYYAEMEMYDTMDDESTLSVRQTVKLPVKYTPAPKVTISAKLNSTKLDVIGWGSVGGRITVTNLALEDEYYLRFEVVQTYSGKQKVKVNLDDWDFYPYAQEGGWHIQRLNDLDYDSEFVMFNFTRSGEGAYPGDKFQITVTLYHDGDPEPVAKAKPVTVTASMGKVNVLTDQKEGQLLLNDRNDVAVFSLSEKNYGWMSSLPGDCFSHVELDSASRTLFDLVSPDLEALGYASGVSSDGTIRIGWKNQAIPEGKLKPKAGSSKTVKLSVWMWGNNSDKPNATISLKIIFR